MSKPLYPSNALLKQVAERWGTPTYLYYEPQIVRQCRALKKAFAEYPTSFFYAVKACSNRQILEIMAKEGYGADVVSIGELERAVKAEISPDKIVFSGVGKRPKEMRRAIELGIQSFHVESLQELKVLGDLASSLGQTARVSLRINPDIDAQTLPYIATGMHGTKFGIAESDLEAAISLWQESPKLQLVGLSCHLGSQITEGRVFRVASERLLGIAENLRKKSVELEFIDLGGGLGVQYDDENVLSAEEYATALLEPLKNSGLKLYLEPGRWLVAEAGHLISEVLYTKQTPKKSFVIVDASMTELIRPALYGAKHPMEVLEEKKVELSLENTKDLFKNLNLQKEGQVDVVGPVCESGDFLLQDHWMKMPEAGQTVVFRTVGAYGMAMASQYNSRTLPAEVLATKTEAKLIRRRQPVESLWTDEENHAIDVPVLNVENT